MTLSRAQLLAEMGIAPLWVRREALTEGIAGQVGAALAGSENSEAAAVPAAPSERVSEDVDTRTVVPRAAFSALEAPSSAGVSASAPDASVACSPRVDASDAERFSRIATLDWAALAGEIQSCRACTLCAQRKQAVPGVGDARADWLFIGEGPGAEEDERGEPFVGQAGRLLDAMLASIRLARGEDVYIANAVKCRPPSNRTPEAAEMAACRPFLARQIALLQPKLIVLLGRAAVQSVLGEDGSLASLRGKHLRYRADGLDVPVVVTYHPAYLLRSLPDKAKAWEDLCRARALMRSAKQADSGQPGLDA